jgi:general secretion pathway protein D
MRRRANAWPLLLGASAAAVSGLVGLHRSSGQATGADTPPPATQPATQPVAHVRLNFKDTPIDAILEHLSQEAGFVIVKDAPVDGRVTVISLQPVTADEAVTLLNTVLKANGLAAIQNGRTLRIVAREKAKKSNIPVHYGADPAAIEPTDELITQVIPIKNVDAVKLRQDLTPLIGNDADVTANGGSNAIVITDTSANIRRVVEIISTLDRHDAGTSEIRIIRLRNASSAAAAKLVLSIFHIEEPRPQPNQPLPPQREGRIPGSGVDQALHGAKITAAADERTNSVVVAGPLETVKLIENMLHELDSNDVAVSTIKSFHLKASNADQVAKLITSIFHEDQTGQVKGTGGDQSLRAHVTAASEDRTNTVIVTAPGTVMTVIEGIITDLESNPAGESEIKSFHLKYADANSVVKVLTSVFEQGESSGPRRRFRERMSITPDSRTNTVIVTASPGALEKVDEIVKELDASPNQGALVKFFHLKQADSVTTAKLITNFFKPPEGSDRHSEGSAYHWVVAEADDRSNTIMITAPPDSMKVVDDIIKEVETDPAMAMDMKSFPLQYADATNTAKMIASLFQGDQQQGNPNQGKPTGKDLALRAKVVAAADDRTNTVVVTAPAETLHLIENTIRLLDANPVNSADIKVFQLQYADASSAAKLLESIFTPGAQSNGSSQSKPPPAAAEMSRHNWVTAAADDRTNTLVVTAPADVLKVAEAIVRQLDANPASEETFFIYRLRNGQAANLEMVLNELFGNYPSNGQGGAGGRPGVAGQAGGLASQLGTGFGVNRSSFSRGGTSSLTSNTGSRAGMQSLAGGANRAGVPPISAGMARAATELTGQVFVVADLDTNSLLVTTASKYQKQVHQIIDELDRPVPQVLIKVLLAEVTHDNAADFGLDFSVLNKRGNGNGQVYSTNLGNAAQASATPGGLVVSLLESNVTATLHALAQAGKLDVLSRPYILASDNQLASITVGQEVPFITDSRITDLGQTINTIQYQDIGIIVNVTPHINPEGLVIMDVAPEISELSGQTVPISEQVSAPIISKRAAESRVGIKNGQTIVIGGLMEDRKTSHVDKVPILGDIPLLQYLFSRTVVSKTKTELLIFLTPHVAQQPETLKPMSDDEMKGTRLTPHAVAPGTFDEHLRGMSRGSVPETQPTTQPNSLQFNPESGSTTQPTTPASETLHLPAR